MEGGQDKFNIVCGWAKAKIDIRVPDLASYLVITKKMQKILKDPRITFSIIDETPAFNVNKISRPVIAMYLKAIEKIEGRKVISHISGGVGDVNHFRAGAQQEHFAGEMHAAAGSARSVIEFARLGLGERDQLAD